MRVFTFLLMMAVAVGGGLAGYRLIMGRDLVSFTLLGFQQPSTPPTVVATPPATAPPSGGPAPTTEPTSLPAQPTPLPDMPQTMLVGNTDGQGVYLRRTPRLDDRLKAWVDGTRMEVIGAPMEADGQRWMRVRAPDGAEGFIPEQFLLEAPR